MTKVQIANGWTDPEGKVHKAGAVIEVSPGQSRALIASHKARPYADPEVGSAEAESDEVAAPVEADKPDPEHASDPAPAESKPTARRATQKGAAK